VSVELEYVRTWIAQTVSFSSGALVVRVRVASAYVASPTPEVVMLAVAADTAVTLYVPFDAAVADPLTVIVAPGHRYEVDPNVIVPAFVETTILVKVFCATANEVGCCLASATQMYWRFDPE
jgi:hypothetical protein